LVRLKTLVLRSTEYSACVARFAAGIPAAKALLRIMPGTNGVDSISFTASAREVLKKLTLTPYFVIRRNGNKI